MFIQRKLGFFEITVMKSRNEVCGADFLFCDRFSVAATITSGEEEEVVVVVVVVEEEEVN